MISDISVVPVDPGHYFLGLVHLARCWGGKPAQCLEWFLSSLRGELPPEKPGEVKNFTVQHIFLPGPKYLLALAALSNLESRAKIGVTS